MIIITCEKYPYIFYKELVFTKNHDSFFISIEYIDNEYNEVIIKIISHNSIRYLNLNNEYHNPVGPAYQDYYENGKLNLTKYYFNNKLHRLDGPAIQYFRHDGSLFFEQYYINGVIFSYGDFLCKKKELLGV